MRVRTCSICSRPNIDELEAEIRKLIDERGGRYGVASEMARRHNFAYPSQWAKHIKKHFVYERAVRADEDEVLDILIEKGYNKLISSDDIPLSSLLSAISIKTKRAELKVKQDMARAMITAFVSRSRKKEVTEGEVIDDGNNTPRQLKGSSLERA